MCVESSYFESSKSANFAAPEVVAIEKTHQPSETGSSVTEQLGPDLLNLGPNGLLSSLGKYASAIVQVVQDDQDRARRDGSSRSFSLKLRKYHSSFGYNLSIKI